MIRFIDSTIKDEIPDSDLIHIMPDLEFALKKVDFKISDTGMNILSSVMFYNPFKIEIRNMSNIEFRIKLENAVIAVILIKELHLGIGLQQMDIDLEITLDHLDINPQDFQPALSRPARS